MITPLRSAFGCLLVAVVLASLGVAQSAPSVQWFPAPEVEARAEKRPWLRLLNTETMSMGRYRLKAGAVDNQPVHAQDEVYYVVAGHGKLNVAGKSRDVSTGDAVYVKAGVPHKFEGITKDLDLLVFFSKAKGSTGGMAAGPKPVEQTPYPETSSRGNTRIFYWWKNNSAGQVSIDYGTPKWQREFTVFMVQPNGKRWRLGQNFWTTLDTNMPLAIGGVSVSAGYYYCVLQNTRKDGAKLILLDPEKVRAQRLDAFEAHKTTGGIEIPLKKEVVKRDTDTLVIELSVDRKKKDLGKLRIHFSRYEMTADVAMKPHR